MPTALGICLALLMLLPPVHGHAAERAQVMVLGTFHFEGSASDGVSVTMGDMLGERRQAEVREVVARLARFRPTRIMVEAPVAQQPRLDADYRRYVEDSRELGANEVEQLGMRLARQLGLDTVHAVDVQQDMDFERMMAAGSAAGQHRLLAWFQTAIGEVQSSLSEAQSEQRTLLEALCFHNGQWALDGNGLYLKLTALGTSEDPAGAEVIGSWYQRNLKIFANIVRGIRGPDERVLVVFGSGHLAQLSQFVEQHPDLELVSALEVLGAP